MQRPNTPDSNANNIYDDENAIAIQQSPPNIKEHMLT